MLNNLIRICQSRVRVTSSILNKQNRLFSLTSILNAEALQLKMPALSPTMTEGTIVKWHKKEGDKISPGDVLFEIQTDKAVLAFDTEEEGILAKIIKQSDANNPIQVGTIVGLIVGENDDWKNVKIPENDTPTTTTSTTKTQDQQSQQIKETPSPIGSSNHQSERHVQSNTRILGPAARYLIHNYNIDINKLNGTGPHGLITKRISPSSSHQQESSEPTVEMNQVEEREIEYIDIELSNMRKVIAKRLLQSKTTIPHSYLDIKLNMNNLIKLRKEYIDKTKIKVSLNDFLIKAISLTLRLVPEMNVNLINENSNESVNYKQMENIDISIAVATDKGLITPIIQNADRLSILDINSKVKELALKARENKLKPNEYQGGSFSISNLGMFGIKQFSAVINPPQIGILAVGNTFTTYNQNEQLDTNCIVTLSFDERAIHLNRSIKFLELLNHFVNNPNILLEQNDNEFFNNY